jgi:hypothetical protein
MWDQDPDQIHCEISSIRSGTLIFSCEHSFLGSETIMAPFYPFYPPYLNVTKPTNISDISQPCKMSHLNNTHPLHAVNTTISESVSSAQANHKKFPWVWVFVIILASAVLALAIWLVCMGRNSKPTKTQREQDIEAARQHVAEAYTTTNEPLPVDHPYYCGREEREIRRLRGEMANVLLSGGK